MEAEQIIESLANHAWFFRAPNSVCISHLLLIDRSTPVDLWRPKFALLVTFINSLSTERFSVKNTSCTENVTVTRWNRELTLKCKLKCYVKPMKDPLGVSPSKGIQGTTRGKETIILTSVGIEPTTSGLDPPLLCRLSYEVGQRKSGTIMVVNRGEEKARIHMNVVPRSTMNTNGRTEN